MKLIKRINVCVCARVCGHTRIHTQQVTQEFISSRCNVYVLYSIPQYVTNVRGLLRIFIGINVFCVTVLGLVFGFVAHRKSA